MGTLALTRAVKTDSGLSAIYDLQAAKRSYCENAVVVLINVDLIGIPPCRCWRLCWSWARPARGSPAAFG